MLVMLRLSILSPPLSVFAFENTAVVAEHNASRNAFFGFFNCEVGTFVAVFLQHFKLFDEVFNSYSDFVHNNDSPYFYFPCNVVSALS